MPANGGRFGVNEPPPAAIMAALALQGAAIVMKQSVGELRHTAQPAE
jgi:hypothetical protein